MKLEFESDSFADGQIGSKLWAAKEIESIFESNFPKKMPIIWVLGGWYGTLPFLLLSRDKLKVKHIRSFDLDPKAVEMANYINNHWEIQNWKFCSFQADCLNLDYHSGEFGPAPDLVINTSCEHFENDLWFQKIPKGTLCLFQSTNMDHGQHCSIDKSLADFKTRIFPESQRYFYEGKLPFSYPDKSFERFMLICEK